MAFRIGLDEGRSRVVFWVQERDKKGARYMRVIADLHIHSRYSMATSRDLDPQHLDLWARYKGIGLLGTGDFTHPAWRQALRDALEPAEEGLYRLAVERLPGAVAGEQAEPRFVVSGEISCIYKQDGRTRKVHNLILLPSLEAAEDLARRLEGVGNIRSDGRPILGLSSRDLLELTLESCPEAVFIPAHIWTPHFSMFGAFSGFSTVEECFGDLSGHIHALETGLSSDPAMNHRVSSLDRYILVSHSDAHSPAKLGREADLLDIPLSYAGMKQALDTGEGFLGTLEFFPEEGKYHLDGHRACGVCLEPEETRALGGICPVCGRKLTVGVQHRVEELADRPAGFVPAQARPYESLSPLQELLAACLEVPPASKAAAGAYFSLLARAGDEFRILREAPLDAVETLAGPIVAEGLRRLRVGQVLRRPGFDGEFGRVSLFAPGEISALKGQTLLALGELPAQQARPARAVRRGEQAQAEKKPQEAAALALNEEQRRAAEFVGHALAVTAGPGTGKTGTLTERVAWLLQGGADPRSIACVTFTNQAAAELLARLERRLGKKAVKGLRVGTFHGLCLSMLPKKALLGEGQGLRLCREIAGDRAAALQAAVSRRKNGLPWDESLPASFLNAYDERLRALNARDLDDVLLEALESGACEKAGFAHVLVDEMQDVGGLQRELVRRLGQSARSLFVIGDRDQSIYGFRGASADCFDELAAALPELERITLRENYRSSPQVLEAALSLISHNPGEERSLHAHAPEGPRVRLTRLSGEREQAAFIAREIAAMTGGVDMVQAQTGEQRPETYAFSDVAVLARTRRQLVLLEDALRREGIPSVAAGRERRLLDERVTGLLGFFRWLLEAGNAPALRDAMGILYGCDEESVSAMTALCKGMETPDLDALDARFGPLGETGLFLADARNFLPKVQKERPWKLLDGWAELHGSDESVETLTRLSLFYKDMASFLNGLLLGEEGDLRSASGRRVPSGAVRLLTLHGAKGLEFPAVFIAGLCRGQLPLERAGETADIEEERRLLFVGMTRAKRELVLCCPGEPSPFMKELEGHVAEETPRRRPQRAKQLSLFGTEPSF